MQHCAAGGAENLRGAFLVCRAFARTMAKARGGRIVNTGSTAAKVPRWEIGAYCVSKAAVLHFTRCLAMELAQYGITVNAVGPGARRRCRVRIGGAWRNTSSASLMKRGESNSRPSMSLNANLLQNRLFA